MNPPPTLPENLPPPPIDHGSGDEDKDDTDDEEYQPNDPVSWLPASDDETKLSPEEEAKLKAKQDESLKDFWGTCDPDELRKLDESGEIQRRIDEAAARMNNFLGDGDLVKMVEATLGDSQDRTWGFVAYRVKGESAREDEERRWEKFRKVFDHSMKKQARTERGGERILDGMKFEWVDLPIEEGENAVEKARIHFNKLVSTKSLSPGLTDEIFLLADAASISSIIDRPPRVPAELPPPEDEGEDRPDPKRVKCEPRILPYVVAVDPEYPGEPGTSYEGSELGYDGTLKVQVRSMLHEFWPAFSTFGLAQGLDELAVGTLGPGANTVFHGIV